MLSPGTAYVPVSAAFGNVKPPLYGWPGLQIAFEDRVLRDICRSESAAAQRYGTELAELLLGRLADIAAAETLEELVVGNVRTDPGIPETFLVDLGNSARMRFRANDRKSRGQRAEALKPSRVSRILVISLEADDA